MMIRKTILITALSLIATLSGVAQQTVGDWNIFTRFMGGIDELVDTPSLVYYTSGNRLFSFDKDNNESYSYSTRNKLNDTDVSLIRYNPEGKYLLVAYTSGNLDLIYDNGKVVNLSDIANATLNMTKNVISAHFANGRIYLGTDFGIVVYDDARHQVIESGIYETPINAVFPVGDVLIIHNKGTNGIMYAPINGHHNTLDKFKTYTGVISDNLMPVGSNGLMAITNAKDIIIYKFNYVDGTASYADFIQTGIKANTGFIPSANGWSVFTEDNNLVTFDAEGNVTTTEAIPAQLTTGKIAAWRGASSVWTGDEDGIANYNVANGNLTLLSDKTKPEGIATDEVFFMHFDTLGRLWTGNLGVSNFKGGYNTDLWWTRQRLTRITDGHPEDMSLSVASATDATTKSAQRNNNSTAMFGGVTNFAIDPTNPERYYQGHNLEGLYVIENDTEIHKFGVNNSPFKGNWGARVMDVNFDPDGNLWVGIWSASASRSPFFVLPKEKLYGNLSTLTAADWIPSKHIGIDVGNKDLSSVICRKSRVIFTYHGAFENPLGILKIGKSYTNNAEQTYFEAENLVDQDGKSFRPTRWACGVEDHDGRVWFGTTSGVVRIDNPAAFTETSPITRVKVPRNDGTNYADYLCETDVVYSIAVDASNRKWIATEASGVYLVSENGDKILEHFTAENSPLPDNMVLSVACDPNSNKVYFGLKSGLVSYSSSSSPAAEDYSDVYAYPNPVRPDYTGHITVTNLMDNSLVKITDAHGNVVHQTRSEGGMIVWDGCDPSGSRVHSGVYYVFASQNANGSSTGAVTKILVVN